MIEINDYWIIDNKIIFKPKFNSEIEIGDQYFNLIAQSEELIFLDSDDYNDTFFI